MSRVEDTNNLSEQNVQRILRRESSTPPTCVNKSFMDSMTIRHRYYITPVPGYVTEYEDSYRWPHRSHSKQYRSCSTNTDTIDRSSAWKKLLQIIEKLIEEGREVSFLQKLGNSVTNKLLDARVEFMFNHMSDIVESQKNLRESIRQGVSVDKKELISDSEFKLYSEFISAINDIKNT